MSTVGGAFSETVLLDLRLRAAELALDDRIKQQFKPDISVLSAVQAVNTSQLNAAFNRTKKDYNVEIIWDNYCDITDAACSDSCTISGNKSSTNAQEVTLSCLREASFSMSESDFINNEYNIDEHIAKAFLKADAALVNYLAQYAVAQIDSFAGGNAVLDGKGTINGANTDIIPAYWNPSLMPYFARVATMNKFTNPVMLSGSNLYEAIMMAEANKGNANGKGDAVLYGMFKWYFDLFNVDSVNTPDLKTYMLSQGSLALVTKTFNPDAPQKMQTLTRYTMPSAFVPGVKYDVWYSNECEENQDRRFKHNWVLRVTGGLFNNPEGCTSGSTGILSFKCA